MLKQTARPAASGGASVGGGGGGALAVEQDAAASALPHNVAHNPPGTCFAPLRTINGGNRELNIKYAD